MPVASSYNNVYDAVKVSTNSRETKRGYLRSLFQNHFTSFKSKSRKGSQPEISVPSALQGKTSPTALPKVEDSKRRSLDDNATWTNRLWQQARDELKDIDSEKKPVQKALPMTQKEKVAQMQDDLMKLVQDAEKGGKIKLTRRRSSDHMLNKVKEMQQDLLLLVKEAEQAGNLRILRRQSTTCINMPGHGQVQLVAVPSKK